ncbi:MAG TPA: hypothetical protein VM577_03260 [Anaerovoracaceae bacterium]|nr:hypothetical protein [Anaerovoracaceae bacterium]
MSGLDELTKKYNALNMAPPLVPAPNFSTEEFLELSRELEKHHSVFYRLWNLGKPIFTDKIKTAAVTFDRLGDSINFLLNYDYWTKLTSTQKQFIICHESLHVILNHGVRMKNASNMNLTNKALDIVVNHGLIERFGFNRKEADPGNRYCWTDTVFPGKKNVPTDKAFEYYYNLLEVESQNGGASSGEIADDHQGLGDFEPLLRKLNEDMMDFEKETIKDMVQKHFQQDNDGGQQAGTSAGNIWVFANVGAVKKKRKWETVIKKWAHKQIKDETEEQWARTNRRMLFFEGDLVIPTEADMEGYDQQKIQVWFFQDTSGSCSGFVDRFFKAASSLPTDRFDVKMHCFDTSVYETTLESKKLYGFGGTTYNCIENYIQAHIKKHGLPYPKAVFIITDGYGSPVRPERPERWHWFLSHSYTQYVPPTSARYMLKDYE